MVIAVAFDNRGGRPVPGAGGSRQRRVDMRLPGTRHQIGHALGDNGGGFIVVRLADGSGARVDIAPHIAVLTDFPHARRQRLRVCHFRHTAAPGQRIQLTQKYGSKGCDEGEQI